MQDQHQPFSAQLFLWPNEIRGEDAVFLHGNSVEGRLNVFGINILAALRDHHVLLAPEKLEMA